MTSRTIGFLSFLIFALYFVELIHDTLVTPGNRRNISF
jgi:hypothetical protein